MQYNEEFSSDFCARNEKHQENFHQPKLNSKANWPNWIVCENFRSGRTGKVSPCMRTEPGHTNFPFKIITCLLLTSSFRGSLGGLEFISLQNDGKTHFQHKFVFQILLLHINITHDKLIICFGVINWSCVRKYANTQPHSATSPVCDAAKWVSANGRGNKKRRQCVDVAFETTYWAIKLTLRSVLVLPSHHNIWKWKKGKNYVRWSDACLHHKTSSRVCWNFRYEIQCSSTLNLVRRVDENQSCSLLLAFDALASETASEARYIIPYERQAQHTNSHCAF